MQNRKIKVGNVDKLFIVLSLYEKPLHGYEILKAGEARGKKISPAEIYPFLRQLTRSKYVNIKKKQNKKIYTLTPRGKSFVKGMLNDLDYVFGKALAKQLKTCAHCECRIYAGGFKKRIKGKTLQFCCKYCAARMK